MISEQTRSAFVEGKPLHTFPDPALAPVTPNSCRSAIAFVSEILRMISFRGTETDRTTISTPITPTLFRRTVPFQNSTGPRQAPGWDDERTRTPPWWKPLTSCWPRSSGRATPWSSSIVLLMSASSTPPPNRSGGWTRGSARPSCRPSGARGTAAPGRRRRTRGTQSEISDRARGWQQLRAAHRSHTSRSAVKTAVSPSSATSPTRSYGGSAGLHDLIADRPTAR